MVLFILCIDRSEQYIDYSDNYSVQAWTHMFQQVAISICIESDELTGLHHHWSSVDLLRPNDVIIGASDHARALFSAERLFKPKNDLPGHWVPHKHFLSPRIPDHRIETRQAITGSRFYAVKLQEGEQPLEQEEERLEQGLEQPLEEEATTGADAAAAAAEPATGAAEPASGADGDPTWQR